MTNDPNPSGDAPPPPLTSPGGLPSGPTRFDETPATYAQAIESITRVSESSSRLAVSTVERLVRTTATWIAGLEERQRRLEHEIDARRFELAQLDALIEREHANAQALVQSANQWAEAAQEEISRKRARVLDDSADLDRQFRVVDESIRGLLKRIQTGSEPEPPVLASPSQESANPTSPPSAPDNGNAAHGTEPGTPHRSRWMRFWFGD